MTIQPPPYRHPLLCRLFGHRKRWRPGSQMGTWEYLYCYRWNCRWPATQAGEPDAVQ